MLSTEFENRIQPVLVLNVISFLMIFHFRFVKYLLVDFISVKSCHLWFCFYDFFNSQVLFQSFKEIVPNQKVNN